MRLRQSMVEAVSASHKFYQPCHLSQVHNALRKAVYPLWQVSHTCLLCPINFDWTICPNIPLAVGQTLILVGHCPMSSCYYMH
jgi:hypothetical protein